MKTTPFTQIHQNLGAKMVNFAGYQMPVEYTGINEEHFFVRQSCGIFDISHMGTIWIKGKGARDTVQWITTNDVDLLYPGKIQYSCFPNGRKGIVDDLLVYMYSQEKYLLVVNASNIDKDYQWIVSNNRYNAIIENSSGKLGQLAVQGPRSLSIIKEAFEIDIQDLKPFHFKEYKISNGVTIIMSNTGYTGENGYEIYFNDSDSIQIWELLMKTGGNQIKPIGLGARDTLRLEMGYCLYGNDIDDNTSPIEAGLGWIVKLNENNQFINRPDFEKQINEGVDKHLIGFVIEDRAIARQHYLITNSTGVEIGEVTSGTMSPVLKKGIGMGYVKKGFHQTGDEIYIKIREKLVKARVVKMPFYKK